MLAVQGARDLTAPVVVVVPVVWRSMIVLGLALRDFMTASACFALWAAEGSVAGLSVVVACVGGARGLATSMAVLGGTVLRTMRACALPVRVAWDTSGSRFVQIPFSGLFGFGDQVSPHVHHERRLPYNI